MPTIEQLLLLNSNRLYLSNTRYKSSSLHQNVTCSCHVIPDNRRSGFRDLVNTNGCVPELQVDLPQPPPTSAHAVRPHQGCTMFLMGACAVTQSPRLDIMLFTHPLPGFVHKLVWHQAIVIGYLLT
jgi:hypothetical protein